MKERVVAVIDLGSNSIRMTVANLLDGGRVEELANYRETVRIGAGLQATGKIDPQAFAKTVYVLQKFCQYIHSFCVEEVVAVATEALRKAENRREFIEHMKETTGICFRLITGEEEAQYDFLGVSEGRSIQNCLLLDIGGGSMELLQIEKGKIQNVISLPLGGVVLTERFLKSDPPVAEELEALHLYIAEQLNQAPWLSECRHWPVFAVGGTNRTVRKLLHKKELLPEEVQHVYEIFRTADLETRKQILGDLQDRADIIVGGLAPLSFIFNELQPEKIVVSEKGLRDGILFTMAQKMTEENS